MGAESGGRKHTQSRNVGDKASEIDTFTFTASGLEVGGGRFVNTRQESRNMKKLSDSIVTSH